MFRVKVRGRSNELFLLTECPTEALRFVADFSERGKLAVVEIGNQTLSLDRVASMAAERAENKPAVKNIFCGDRADIHKAT